MRRVIAASSAAITGPCRDLSSTSLPWLQVASYSADKTHAERAHVQQAFDAGHISILIATTAFGLGINKKDIRWVRTRHAYCCAQTAARVDLQ